MSIIQGNAHTSTGGYQIERSLRFNSADSAYLDRTLGTSNRRTFTFSVWLKRSVFASTQCIFGNINYAGGGSTNQQFFLGFTGSDQLDMFHYNNGTQNQVTSSAVYRDPSAWYHIVGAVDTTQATSSNRLKIYVNGSQVTTLATSTYPAQNTDTFMNANLATGIGRQFGTGISGSYFNDGYLTEIYFIDGQQLTPSDFGETDSNTGVWKPKAYFGTYGTNGFYLKFADNSNTTAATLGKDSSGNGNNWTPNNFSVTAGTGNDSLVDTPTPYGTDTGVGGEVRGNYATLNPLVTGSFTTLSNANLNTFGNTSSNNGNSRSTFAMQTGKWYIEATLTASNLSIYPQFGIMTTADGDRPNNGPPQAGYGSGMLNPTQSVIYMANGQKQINSTASSYGSSFTNGDVIGIAIDSDNGAIYFSKNGVFQNSGVPTSGATKTGAALTWTGGTVEHVFSIADYNGTATAANFGQRPFAYTAPSGFKALCTQNLPTPTIGATSTTQANDYFNPVLYTGNGGSQSVTGVGFQPDWVWVKVRSSTQNHSSNDSVRGAGNYLVQNATAVERFQGEFDSFDSDGFSLTYNAAEGDYNGSGKTYVAWNWKANGAGSSNTAGTITSTVSANTTSGFSIVTFTTNNTAGATVGHGLGAVPDMIIMKYRGLAANWVVYHKSMNATPQNGYLNLNTTAAYAALIDPWNNTAPSSTVITMGAGVGSAGSTNYGVYTSVAYCFSAVAGYSAFGSYTGNGSTDGPFVYTGFRPRYVLIKRTSNTQNWQIHDTSRNPYNSADNYFEANTSDAETADVVPALDILSNGFKIKTSNVTWNGSGDTYIYACFAESPFKYSLAR